MIGLVYEIFFLFYKNLNIYDKNVWILKEEKEIMINTMYICVDIIKLFGVISDS